MTGMSPSRWHFGRCCCYSKGKNMYFYYHSSKECVKLKREFNGVWSQGWHQEKTLTPCYYDSDSHVSTHGCLQTQTRRDKWAFQLQDGFCLPGTAQVPVEKSCRSLYVIKNYFLFQDLVNKRAFPFFSKKRFRFKETLKFEVWTPVTPFSIWSHHLHTCWYMLTAGVYCSQLCLFSRKDFNLKSIPPTSIRKLNWP